MLRHTPLSQLFPYTTLFRSPLETKRDREAVLFCAQEDALDDRFRAGAAPALTPDCQPHPLSEFSYSLVLEPQHETAKIDHTSHIEQPMGNHRYDEVL